MAKKKAKKKKTKKAKKHYPLGDDKKPLGLQAKILKVMELLPVVECTGEEYDETTGDMYHYTQAEVVFKLYNEAMVKVGLTMVPVDIITDVDKRFYKATITYRITSTDTEEFVDVVAVGLGCNGVWALNTAQTVARKQALLNTFGASYPQPDDAKKTIRKIARGFEPYEVLTTQKAREELVNYDFFNEKEKQDENQRNNQSGSGQGVSTGKSSQKDRPRGNDKAQTRGKKAGKSSSRAGK